MNILNWLFKKQQPSIQDDEEILKSGGDLIVESTGGACLVDGKQTWELAKTMKHDIDTMKRCCDAELKIMDKAGMVPAPYYFERVAILSRKEKNYEQEILYCEMYIEKVEAFYAKHGTSSIADVRKGPTYQAIAKRLPKARELHAKKSV